MPKLSSTKKPLATKVARKLASATKQKVLDLDSIRQGHAVADELKESAPKAEQYADFHPAHAMYVDALNKISALASVITQLDELDRISDVINAAEDEYVPGGPPMSPVTDSFFITWSLFDCGVGIERETIGSVLIHLGASMGMDDDFHGVLEKWQASRMGLYVLEKPAKETALLREVVTGVVIEAVNPTGYEGTASNLWYARVLPPPVPQFKQHIIVTTPYEIMAPRKEGWLTFLERTLPKTKLSNPKSAYEHLMKWGLSNKYWLEYVLEAYFNDDPEGIRLMGLPDVAESRPNSRLNQDDARALRKYVESGQIMTGDPP